MDKNSRKILKFYNSHPNDAYSVSVPAKFFPDIPPRDIVEIAKNLKDEGYLRIIGTNQYQSTNKGKTRKSVTRNNWISEHIIETLALIVAFIALIVSIIAIVRTL